MYVKRNKHPYPQWICAPCGSKYGRTDCKVATWHIDTCDLCKKEDVRVTEPRDYGHLKPGWENK